MLEVGHVLDWWGMYLTGGVCQHSYQVSLIHSETHFFQYCLTFSLFI